MSVNALHGLNSLLLAHAVCRILRSRRARPRLLRGICGMSLACTAGLGLSSAHAELPAICVSGASCGNSSSIIANAISSGTSIAIEGNNMAVNQTTANAVLHWNSFNISSGSSVTFNQPDSSSVALNRIYQDSASQILGNLTANGRIYLLNQNGIVFGNGAQVNVAGLIASSLDIAPVALNADGTANLLQSATDVGPTFRLFSSGSSGDINIQQGASITTSEDGQVFIFAPNITNAGTITTPGGQTVLAAGTSVYLAASSDENLRGVLVELGAGAGGAVTNGVEANAGVTDPAQLVGQIVAERGNITLAGLAVQQLGRVSATTSVNENGSIRLQARDGGSFVSSSARKALNVGDHGGTLVLGQDSATEVTLATSAETAADVTDQLRSQIKLQGHEVLILEDAQVSAKGGSIDVSAQANPRSTLNGTTDDGSRIYIAEGATLDVSGADIELAMERNIVSAELRGDELADSPVQRDGALRGETVYVDIRDAGTREDGSTWQGTPLGDVSGQISLVERDVAERNLLGGAITLQSQGDVIVAAGSTLDISGGSITYQDGYINTTKLLGADGKVYDIADADPNRVYTGTTSASTYTVTNSRWGVSKTYVSVVGAGSYEQGYVEGKDAGTLKVVTPTAILDGEVKAEVQVGRYQRELATSLVDGQIYRAYDQLPLGGQLIFGMQPTSNDRIGGDVVFGGELVLQTLANDDGSEFDPETDELPTSVEATSLRSELFGDDRIARIEVNSNGAVSLPQEVALSLPGQGALKIRAAHVDVAGQVTAPAGVIDIGSLQTVLETSESSLELAGTALLDVSGQWVNDSLLLNEEGEALAPLLIDGGNVSLSAGAGSLTLETGSIIDVSGGAWAKDDGSVVAGDAGAISLSASGNLQTLGHSVVLDLGAELRAFGFEDGGTLSISAPEICVAADGECGTDVESTLELTPEDLLAGGFSDITLKSNERGLLVESGTQLDLQQRNRVLEEGALNAASGTDLDSISSTTILADYLRAATNLSLRTAVSDRADGASYTNANFSSAPALVIESGAIINADPGASLALQSNSTLLIEGELTAKGGNISLTLDNSLFTSESIDAQGIWLGADSKLDVSGVALLEPNALGLRTGVVLDGGTVSIEALRGAVIANPGSEIDVSGASATLDIGNVSGSVVNTTPTLIASDGGAVSVTAADAILLSGDIDAHAGAGDASAMGGALQVELDANEREGSRLDRPTLEIEERRIVVSQSLTPVAIAAGSELPDDYSNQALLAADAIEAAGFDSVTLTAQSESESEYMGGPRIDVSAAIEFDGDVTLSVGRELVLDAARITGDGDVSLNAPYLALGHSDTKHQELTAPVSGGTGSLTASAAFIEVIGNSTIDGFDAVALNSSGDLRLRGVQQFGASTVDGALLTSADLTLKADQMYATTLSDFDVTLANNADGVLRIESTGEARDAVLSAASHLTLNAPTIEQAGVLRAPFGTIELNADVLTLEAGSLTSTSAENAIIPFGSIQADTDWVYSLEGQTLVVGDAIDIPEQNVVLTGTEVSIVDGAVIDVSGGGDLLAYEFVPGTNGNIDVLSATEEPGRFAIVPALSLNYAPYDTQESADSSLSVGDTIHISAGVEGLPEGDYVLLPARYALLEGAYVVEAVSGYTDLQAGEVLQQLDGSTIVSGYLKVANTEYADTRSSGFAVTSGAVLAEQAQYDTTLASEFFAEQAEANDTALPRLSQDAGVLSIAAVSQLNIDGQLRAIAVEGGRGAAVDISAENLVISETAVAAEGEVVVSASDLTALGAESLLLGGSRASADEGVSIDVASTSVTVAGDAEIVTPELLIAATDTVRVAAGASLTASGELPVADTYLVEGDGAMLRLAAGEQAEIRRDNESAATGTLVLEQGAQLTAIGGALALDASLDVQSDATLALDSGSLSLGASRINLAETGVTAAGLTLDATQLSNLNLNQLVLVSRSSIDLYGDVALDVNEVVLDAAGLRSQQGGASASIATNDSIVLSNRADRSNADASISGGSLQLSADAIVIGEGAQRISGYDDVSLIAATQVRGEETGALNVVGDVTVSTPVLLASTGSEVGIQATGDLRVVTPGAIGVAQDSELGGSISLSGATVNIASRVEAAAGEIAITASAGDVTLADGAVLDASGRLRDFDGTPVAAPAGEVSLTSVQGNVAAQSGSVIDVAAADDGAAGLLEITAANGAVALAGELRADAIDAGDSGRVSIDAQNLGDFSALNAALNAAGFNAERELRQRSGDVQLSAGNTLTAQQVSLTADQGNILIDGVIDARGDEGGDVVVSAQSDVIVNGSILASAETAAGDGGELDLRADAGGIRINSGALIDMSAGADNDSDGGELNLRVTRDIAITLNDADAGNDALVLAGTLEGVEQTTLEAYQRYTDTELGLTGSVITSAYVVADADNNVLFGDASRFIDDYAEDITAALGRTDDASFRLLPGIEIQSDGALSLGVDWDLSSWRFGTASVLPGVLTLRAAGGLTFDASLSDGFTGATGDSADAFNLTATSDSWSYRLVAGADNDSADLLAVGDDPEADFKIADGVLPSSDTDPGDYRMVRTGNGSIDVAASGDFILGNQASVLYTAGVASVDGVLSEGLDYRSYPVDGGDISIDVQGDIEGAQTDQLVTDWLWRVGKESEGAVEDESEDSPNYSTAWTVNFARFMQNVAALGGGDIDVAAGGDISNFSASIPSIGQQVGSMYAHGSVVDVIGGGDLTVRAGGDIAGGSYYVGLGIGELISGSDVTSSYYSIPNSSLYPVLALGDGQWNVTASGSVGIEAVVNPTLLPQGKSQGSAEPDSNFSLSVFSTYAETSAVNLLAVAGDVVLSNDKPTLTQILTSMDWGADMYTGATSLMLYAPSLSAASLSADLVLNRDTTLYPAAGATLQLFAENNIGRDVDAIYGTVVMPDVDPAYLPSIEKPWFPSNALFSGAGAALRGSGSNAHAATPVHAGDDSVAHIVARVGDIDFGVLFGSSNDQSQLALAMPVRVVAGGDIIDLPLTVQHDDAGDVSSIVAGGDIRYTVARTESGILRPNAREIVVDGPGTLLITAGGDVDLQTSTGISSRGNLVNTNLPEEGADISVLAGLNGKSADYSSFEQQYLVDIDTYAAALDEYVAQMTGAEPDSHASALTLFASLSEQQKAPFLQKVLLEELRASAINAASSDPEKNGDYSRGFKAMSTLFPDEGAYDGDIALYFSRIYTQDGGDITLLTPGGGVNAGLATPPSAFGVTKGAEELGIVSQRGGDIGIIMDQDLQVNESRVFAVNSSDIVVWSSNGDIDAGRGAKTAISAPDALISYDHDGRATAIYSASLAGSGIQTRATTAEYQPGDVVLAAPRGVVNAGDAGIVAGNLTIAATAVLGADNIKVSGVSVGVPVDAGGLGASLAGISAAASSASNAATTSLNSDDAKSQQAAPIAEAALSWLEVFVVGLGEENCKQDDLECLKRQQTL